MMTGLESFRSLQVVAFIEPHVFELKSQVNGCTSPIGLSEFIQWYMKVAFFSYSLDYQIIEAFQGTNVET